MTMQFVAAVRNTRLDAIRDALDAGAGAGILAIYSGTKPATPATALSGNTLLAKIALANPAAPNASSGVLTFDFSPAVEDLSADATGTATWFRLYSSADGATISEANAVGQGTVSASGAGGDLELVNTSLTATQPVQITSGTITEGGA